MSYYLSQQGNIVTTHLRPKAHCFGAHFLPALVRQIPVSRRPNPKYPPKKNNTTKAPLLPQKNAPQLDFPENPALNTYALCIILQLYAKIQYIKTKNAIKIQFLLRMSIKSRIFATLI